MDDIIIDLGSESKNTGKLGSITVGNHRHKQAAFGVETTIGQQDFVIYMLEQKGSGPYIYAKCLSMDDDNGAKNGAMARFKLCKDEKGTLQIEVMPTSKIKENALPQDIIDVLFKILNKGKLEAFATHWEESHQASIPTEAQEEIESPGHPHINPTSFQGRYIRPRSGQQRHH